MYWFYRHIVKSICICYYLSFFTITLHFKYGNWNSDTWRNLSKVTQRIGIRPRIQSQVDFTHADWIRFLGALCMLHMPLSSCVTWCLLDHLLTLPFTLYYCLFHPQWWHPHHLTHDRSPGIAWEIVLNKCATVAEFCIQKVSFWHIFLLIVYQFVIWAFGI